MKILTTLATAMLLSTLAMAQEEASEDQDEPTPITKAAFESLDRNSDARLSKTEAAADDNVSSQFAALDANSDGYLNRSEYADAPDPTVSTPSEPPLPGPGGK